MEVRNQRTSGGCEHSPSSPVLRRNRLLCSSLRRLFRPQQQGRRSVNPFKSVPAVPSGALHVNAVGGSKGGAVIAKKLDYAFAPRYRVPSVCPVPGESRRCRPTTGRSRRIFASTEIVTGALRDGILPTITHLRPDKPLRKGAFQKGFASHSRNRLKNKHPDFTFPVVSRVKVRTSEDRP